MQTRDNAENVVFNVPRFSNQVIREMQYRDTGQTGSRKTIKSQNQRADVRRYQGAGGSRRRGTQNKSHQQEAEGQTDPEGAGKKLKSNNGCLQRSLNNLAYR